MSETDNVFVTGATGYVERRLTPRLMSEGYGVRASTRDSARIDPCTNSFWFSL